jgi:hypothetical protein
MGPVATSLATIGTTQVLLASVFLGSYALALGKFAGTHGRLIATATAVLSAAGFVALSNPWEAGVILLAFIPVGMALFAGVTWTLWKVMAGSVSSATLVESVVVQRALQRATAGLLLERVRTRRRPI